MLILEIGHDGTHKLLGALDRLEITRNAILLGPFHGNDLVQLHQSDGAVHITVTVAADTTRDGIDKLGVAVGHLHTFDGNVLASHELDQILLPIDDAQTAILHELANISRVEPAIFSEFLQGLLGHHVVAQGNVVPLDHDLTTAVDAVALHIVSVGLAIRNPGLVGNVGAGIELHLHGGDGNSSNTSPKVGGVLDGQTGGGFGEAVSLEQRTSEARADKDLDLAVERTATGQGQAQPPTDDLGELLEDQRLEEGGVVSVLDGKGPGLEGRVDQELRHRRREGNLGLDPLLDHVPNLGHTGHDGGRILLQGADGVGTGGRQSLGVGVADRAAHGDACELGHQLEDVGQGQVSEVDVLPVADAEALLPGGDGGHDLRVGDGHALGIAGAAAGVHDDGAGGGLGRGGGEGRGGAGFDEVLHGHDLHSLGGLGQVDGGAGSNEVGRVDDGLEGLHVLDAAGQDLDVGLVANDGADNSVVDGLDDGVDAERGVDGRHDDGLGEGTEGGDHPLGTGVLEDGQRAGSLDLVQGALFGSRDEAGRTEGGAELLGGHADLLERSPLDVGSEVLHLGAALVLAEELPVPRAVAVGVALEGILGQVVQGAHAVPGGFQEVALVSGRHAMAGIVADGDRSLGLGRQELLQGLDPAKGQGHDQEVQRNQEHLEGQ
mmetsp:Transcript_12468/g.29489  ORF Transcript_12468/g.29489 Transcript_12468/m.29489 type:complete len:662 (+) Transcript_12468:306-2291(+)